MFKSKLRKTKLSLALSTALVGGALSLPAQAVQLTHDGLGDAAMFQYFTANSGWQTFIRLINTDPDNVVAVKVHFREAANSREILDFIVLLSPNDVWTAWTDRNAASGGPGIRTTDTSCIIPLPNSSSDPDEGFKTVSGNLKAAAFKDRAITGDYFDGSSRTVVKRLSEGHIEVIGIASFSNNGFARDLASAATHAANGHPESCAQAQTLFNRTNPIFQGTDVGNVIGANAYLVNVSAGQGAGYDPTILANFTNVSLTQQAITTDAKPDLDSARPVSEMLDPAVGFVDSTWNDPAALPDVVAFSQILANGTQAMKSVTGMDLNNDGDITDTITIDDGFGNCVPTDESNVPDNLVGLSFRTGGPCQRRVSASDAPGAYTPPVFTTQIPAGPGEARIANLSATGMPGPVTGGVDAVSALLMRTSVINEWAAAENTNAGATVTDYFTQWIINFPTKHHYVDLQDDANPLDDVAPTLQDPRGDLKVDPVTGAVVVADLNDAFAPFSHEFNIDADGAGPDAIGLSCEYYSIGLWDREESAAGFTSPAPYDSGELCYETNVIGFNNNYIGKGLNSHFDMLVPTFELPINRITGKTATKGWARLSFDGVGAATGLTSEEGDSYYGLPVDGFMFSVYNTGAAANNHAAANAHKYERNID